MADGAGAPSGPASGPQRLLGLLVGFLLFGDYLSLSVSRLLTGSTGNWIAVAAVLQPAIVVVALLTGNLRQRFSLPMALAWLGLCVIAFGHAVPVWLNGDDLSEYSLQKLMALVLLAGPALAAGHVVGAQPQLLGARTMPWLMAPLIGLCAIAVATDPRLLTIEFYADPPVFFGTLVLPTHQPLAFCLTKAALVCFAAERRAARAGAHGIGLFRLGCTGALLGLVLLTGARSYTVALGVALAAIALLDGRRFGLVLIGGAVALGLFQFYAGDLVQERLDPTQVLQSIAFRDRELAWEAALQGFFEHPLVGVGAGCFGQLGGWSGRVYPHNLPLEIAVEFGLVGAICFAVLLGTPLLQLARAFGQRTRPGALGQFGVGMLLFTFCGSLAVGDLIRNHVLFFAIGLAAASLRGAAVPAPQAANAPEPAPIAPCLATAGASP